MNSFSQPFDRSFWHWLKLLCGANTKKIAASKSKKTGAHRRHNAFLELP
jgi:hypothetical protein